MDFPNCSFSECMNRADKIIPSIKKYACSNCAMSVYACHEKKNLVGPSESQDALDWGKIF